MTPPGDAPSPALRAEAFPARAPGCGRLRSATRDRPRHEPSGAGAHRESSAPRPSGLPRSLTGLKVVVVDDDDGSLEYFAAALRACGAAVLTASTALDALQLVRQGHPDVVLSDLAMVGHDGYWLVREIRRLRDEAARLVPVVATTAYGWEHSRARALAAGFDEHLQKPVDPVLLCRTVAGAAGR